MLSVFDELIFDRSLADLSNNSSRAYHNLSDMQRINEACVQLSKIFNQAGIANKIYPISAWS